MNMRSLTQTKAESSFTSVQTGLLQRRCATCGQHTISGGECAECQKKHSLLQRRAVNQEQPSAVPPIVYEVLNSPGQPLDAATRAFMESRFGHDFSQVRVHTDAPLAMHTKLKVSQPIDAWEQQANQIANQVMDVASTSSTGKQQTQQQLTSNSQYDFSQVRIHTDQRAAAAAQAVNALAYTVGRDIVFGAGQFTPGTKTGQKLLAHELAHVVQHYQQPHSDGHLLSRAPASPSTASAKPSTEPTRPEAKLTWTWKDLAVYPLLVDVWKDVILQKLTTKEREQLALKGTESAAFFAWLFALPLGVTGTGGERAEDGVGKTFETTKKYAEALQPLTPSKDVIMDGISRIAGIRIDEYLSSDLFMSRLKAHTASVVSLALLAQGAYSLVQAVKKPDVEQGQLTPEEWSKHIGLVTGLIKAIFKEHLKAPDFFDVGPLQMATHPAFSAAPFVGGGTPSGLTAEGSTGFGEEGKELKLGLTLNLPKLIVPAMKENITTTDIGDLKKYRGWQGSLWFTYDRLDPTRTMEQAGKLPEAKFRSGTIFGTQGHLGLLEFGARYSGDQAKDLTSWFLKGGYGYSGASGSNLKKIGFTVTYVDWKETDILAPRRETGVPVGGRAARITPFTSLEFGDRHKFGVGAALSFVTGSAESFNVSDFRADFSYTYMGNNAPNQLPVFKLDLSGSMHRLDWWNPNSPLLWGVQAKGTLGRGFLGAQVMTGAQNIPETRASLLGEPIKVRVPTAVLFIAGYAF